MTNNSKPSIEEVRNFWDRRPCNIRHSTKALGSREYFDEVEKRKYFVEAHIPGFAKFEEWKDKNVLEIGCGIGTDAVNFARNGASYTGIELSSSSLELTKKRFEIFELEGVFIEGDIEFMPEVLADQVFDLIYSFGVLHHTVNITNALRNVRKLCGKRSIFRFMVYAKNSWKNCMIEAGLDQPEAQFGCPIANTYTVEEISNLLQAAGFEANEIKQDHIFPYEITKYKNHEYEKLPWFKSMPSEVFRVLERNFGWHLLVEARPIL